MRAAARFLGIAAAVVGVVGCAPGLGSPEPTLKPSYTLAPPTPTISPIGTAGPAAHSRPYGAGDLTAALADPANRLPPELRAEWLAPPLAEAVWTYDGKPYRELTIAGSCDEGAPRCDLHVGGLPSFAPDREAVDGYTFSVDLASQTIAPAGRPSLKGFPAELVPGLDATARSQDTLGQLDGMFLRNAVWTIPPPADAYALAYATGTLEGDRGLLVTVDRATGTVVSVVPT